MTRCTCAIAARWWRPAANPLHGGPYCQQVGRVLPWSGDRPPIVVTLRAVRGQEWRDPQQLRKLPRLVYDDGKHYGVGWPTMDSTAYVLESSFDVNRPDA